jgi:23S rRNA (pseudouridine1915-N3)-methyltransferase
VRVALLAIGQKMPAWITAGYDDYARRLPPHLKLDLVERPASAWATRGDVARAMREEADILRASIPKGAWVVALDERGSAWSTSQLSSRLAEWQQGGRDVALLIGGPDGLDASLRDAADQRWSLSPLTLPHPLVRVVVAEQLYRAWTLLAGHPYHRDGIARS